MLVLNAGSALTVWANGVAHDLPGQYDCLHLEERGGLAEYRLDGAGALDACVIELSPRAG
ncbi:hypothetical protein D9M68_885850 [compost metagenome]